MTQIKITDNASAERYIREHEPNVKIVNDYVLTTCKRCGGSGHYAFNYLDGTRCYGCGGHGRGRPVPVVKYARRIKSRKAAHARQARKIERETAERKARADAWRADHPDVQDALVPGVHRILDSLIARLDRWGSLSEAQCALALRIAGEQARRDAEVNVPAPTGRQTFTGRIVSSKWKETRFGESLKITVKVETDAGVWLAWLTAPAALIDAWDGPLTGATVTITATLERGNDAHFAFGTRPRLVSGAVAAAA